MKRYLDPKADLIFKKVFGEHKQLVKSLLNAMLPLDPNQVIDSIEYLPAEIVPETPMGKNSIVDVRCKDNYGRHFIVEMQMLWTDGFKSRVLLNASKAVARQLSRGISYGALQPVYALSFINQIFKPEIPQFYHHYQIIHREDNNDVIDGLQMIFIELPKFKPESIAGRKMQVLWMRFLTEIDERTEQIDAELLDDPEVKQAIEYVEESGYSKAELEAYDRLWDGVNKEITLRTEAEEKGMKKGMEKGMEKGIKKGMEKGKNEAKKEIAVNLKKSGMAINMIAQITGLSESEIEKL